MSWDRGPELNEDEFCQQCGELWIDGCAQCYCDDDDCDDEALATELIDSVRSEEDDLGRIAAEDVQCTACQLLSCDRGSLCGLEQAR